jgi:hypothetical protein
VVNAEAMWISRTDKIEKNRKTPKGFYEKFFEIEITVFSEGKAAVPRDCFNIYLYASVKSR